MSKPTAANLAQREALVIAVATGTPVARFCKRAGIPRSTATGWTADPAFNRDVEAARSRILDRAAGKLMGSLERIAEGMIRLAESASSEPVQLGSMRAAFDTVLRLIEVSDLRRRIAALEESLAGGPPGGDVAD